MIIHSNSTYIFSYYCVPLSWFFWSSSILLFSWPLPPAADTTSCSETSRGRLYGNYASFCRLPWATETGVDGALGQPIVNSWWWLLMFLFRRWSLRDFNFFMSLSILVLHLILMVNFISLSLFAGVNDITQHHSCNGCSYNYIGLQLPDTEVLTSCN